MKISFLPIRSDAALSLTRAGDVLHINGEAFDFAALPEGGSLPAAAVRCDWLTGEMTREGGVLCLTLLLPHGAGAPRAALFPQPVTVDSDGPVALPGQTPTEAS